MCRVLLTATVSEIRLDDDDDDDGDDDDDDDDDDDYQCAEFFRQ